MEILPQLLVNALIAGSIYALASSGLSLTYGLLRILNFAHGHFMMVGAYAYYFLTVQSGLVSVLPGSLIAVAGLLTGLFVIAFAAGSLRIFIFPFLSYSVFLPFVTTLALSTILESLVSMIFGVNVKTFNTGAGIRSIEIWGVYITPIQIVIIVSALILIGSIAFVVHSTPLGRRIRALSEHPFAAESLGISRNYVSNLIFVIGALLAAFAGIMVGYETNLQPTMGGAYTIKAFAAMILGGLGNIWGTIAGSYLLGLIENLSIGLEFPYKVSFQCMRDGGNFWDCCSYFSIPAGYKDAFSFAIILLVLLFRPKGLFNTRSRES